VKVRKSHQLEEVAALMDELAPSLLSSASGGASAAPGAGVSSSKPSSRRTSGGDVDGAGGDGAAVGETVIGRCTAAALATGVDCVLDEEFSASREPARVAGFSQVRGMLLSRRNLNACSFGLWRFFCSVGLRRRALFSCLGP